MNVTTVVTIVAGLLGGGGVVAVVNAIAGRRVSRADAAGRLSEGALRWVDEFQRSASGAESAAAAARAEAAAARSEIADLHGQLIEVRDQARRIANDLREEARRLANDLYQIHRAARDPTMTLDQLRDVVAKQATENPDR
jgi:chromosome segregation ATPase